MFPDVSLFIDGRWTKGSRGRGQPILNPATGEELGLVPHAEADDLDGALCAALRGFRLWRRVSAFDRCKLLRRAADQLRGRVDSIAEILTREHGKPLAEARAELLGSADVIDWFAEEGRRAYGRVIPARANGVYQLVVKEPVGPVAAFSPWNFRVAQTVRKIAAALAAGCSIIIKGPEDTPASCAAMIQAFIDAELPAGVLNLVFGVPAEVSEHLIPHPAIRKISFTGSTAVGKRLAALAGQHMKRATMELGGHAPAIVFEDADVDLASRILSSNKFRNAGQICTSPTRFLVHEQVYRPFLERFVAAAKSIQVGDGLDPKTQMGPLVRARRVEAMEAFVADAISKGAKLATGGKRIGNKGFFFEPTVLTEVPTTARIMNEEPFGPVAPIVPFKSYDAAIEEANRLPYGLGAFAYTRSVRTAAAVADDLEAGMVSINHHGLALPEVPFGGIKDSGYGSEGGSEAVEEYLIGKFVTQATA